MVKKYCNAFIPLDVLTRNALFLIAIASGLNTPSTNEALQLSGEAAFSYLATLPKKFPPHVNKSERAATFATLIAHDIGNQSRGKSKDSTAIPVAAVAPVHVASVQLRERQRASRLHQERKKTQTRGDWEHIATNGARRYMASLSNRGLGGPEDAITEGAEASGKVITQAAEPVDRVFVDHTRDDDPPVNYVCTGTAGLGGGMVFVLITCLLWKWQLATMREEKIYNHDFPARAALYTLVGRTSQRTPARIFRWGSACYVLFNVAIVILESSPQARSHDDHHEAISGCGFFEVFEAISSFVYLFEYCFRWYAAIESKHYRRMGLCCAGRLRWMLSFDAVIDVVATLPYFVEVFVHTMYPDKRIHFRSLTWLRVLRLFRLFKIDSVTESLDVFARVLYYNAEILIVSLILCTLLTLVLSVLIYYLAPQDEEASGNFSSITGCIYLAILMLTGQGQPEGKLPWYTKAIVCITCIFAVGLFAIQASMLTWGFEVEAGRRIVKAKERKRERVMTILQGGGEDKAEVVSESSADEDLDSDWEQYEELVAGDDSDAEEEEGFENQDNCFCPELERIKEDFSPKLLNIVTRILKYLDFSNGRTIDKDTLANTLGINAEVLQAHDVDGNQRISCEELLSWISYNKHKLQADVFKMLLESLLKACQANKKNQEGEDEYETHVKYIEEFAEHFRGIKKENERLKNELKSFRGRQSTARRSVGTARRSVSTGDAPEAVGFATVGKMKLKAGNCQATSPRQKLRTPGQMFT